MKAAKLPLHSPIFEVRYIEAVPLFSVSWLHKEELHEYQRFLENVKGVRLKPTTAMIEGKQEHELLQSHFTEKVVPATFEEMLSPSKTAEVSRREFRVIDAKHGIQPLIDEVLLPREVGE